MRQFHHSTNTASDLAAELQLSKKKKYWDRSEICPNIFVSESYSSAATSDLKTSLGGIQESLCPSVCADSCPGHNFFFSLSYPICISPEIGHRCFIRRREVCHYSHCETQYSHVISSYTYVVNYQTLNQKRVALFYDITAPQNCYDRKRNMVRLQTHTRAYRGNIALFDHIRPHPSAISSRNHYIIYIRKQAAQRYNNASYFKVLII